MRKILFFAALTCTTFAYSQNVAINSSGAAPVASAMLDIASTSSGLLIPRMTTAQRTAIASPATGLLVYDTNLNAFLYFDGTIWRYMAYSGGWLLAGNALTGTEFLGSTNAQDLKFYTNNAERMRITSGGVAGINTTAPATSGMGLVSVDKFNVTGSTGVAGGDMVEFLNTSAAGVAQEIYNSSTANTYNALESTTNYNGTAFIPSGVFGLAIQTTGSAYAVRGAGNAASQVGVRGSVPTTPAASWTGYGGLFTGGLGYANGVYNLSDRRVKKDVAPITNAIDLIKKINGVSYKYNTDVFKSAKGDDRTYLGFIAQDIETVLPEVVANKKFPLGMDEPLKAGSSNTETFLDAKVVDYVQLVPVLVEAIKEQQKKIEQLEKEIKELKEKK